MPQKQEALNTVDSSEQASSICAWVVFLGILAVYGFHYLGVVSCPKIIQLIQEGFIPVGIPFKIFGWFLGAVMIVLSLGAFDSSSSPGGEFCDGGLECGDSYDSYTYY